MWSEYEEDWSHTIKSIAKEENLSLAEAKRLIVDSIEDQDAIFEPGDWVLAVKVGDASKVTAASWFFVDRALLQGRKQQTIVELRGGRRGYAPFSFEAMGLRTALSRMLRADAAMFDHAFAASERFIANLAQRYAGEA